MKKFRIKAATVAVFAVLALIGQEASATPVPIADPDFYNQGSLGAWTPHSPPSAAMQYTFNINPDTIEAYNTLPSENITHAAHFNAGISAYPAPPSQSLSQVINGLITGHQYELTFWAVSNQGYGVADPVPMSVTFGSYTSPPIPLNNVNGHPYFRPYPWALETLDFTYTDPGTSALLTFIQNLKPVAPGCFPCDEDSMYLSNVALNDVTTVTPPPPTPQVAEPSSLLTAAFGVGLLGLYFRRRSKHGDLA